MELMKEPYQHPVMQVLSINRAVPILAASYLKQVDAESGGDIDPNTEVETGLSRQFGFDEFDY